MQSLLFQNTSFVPRNVIDIFFITSVIIIIIIRYYYLC